MILVILNNSMISRFIFCILVLSTFACGNNEKSSKAKSTTNKAAKELSSSTNEIKQAESTMTAEQLKKATDIIATVSEEELKAIDSKKIFKSYCALCHGFNGRMNVNGAKDLTISSASLEESVAQVYFGKGLMTPFKGVLKDDEIVAVCTYIAKELRE